MRRFAVLTALVTLVLAGSSIELAIPLVAGAQEASPAASGPPPGLEDEILAVGMTEVMPETPAIMLMERVTVAPGAAIPAAPGDPTLSFFRIESGALTIGTDTPLAVIRAAALEEALATPGTMPTTEDVAADAEVTLAAGDSVVIPPGVGGELRNDGAEPVVILVTQIVPAGA